MTDIGKIEKTIGYKFSNAALLETAFRHSSVAKESGQQDNEKLEFLGDAVLEIILTEYLFHLYPDAAEGEMTKIRSALVREPALARLARRFELGEYLLTGRGEHDSGGADRDSTLADLFEAVLGAFYLDAGFDATRQFVTGLIRDEYPDPRSLLTSINPKGQLQEYSQRRWGLTPKYAILHTSGPEHLPVYEVEVRLSRYNAVGRAANRKAAEGDAARQLYRYLSNKEPEA